jgi:hypothetical protein
MTLADRHARLSSAPPSRQQIERNFGKAKSNKGLERAHLRGRATMHIQGSRTILALNAKRILHLLDARPPATAPVMALGRAGDKANRADASESQKCQPTRPRCRSPTIFQRRLQIGKGTTCQQSGLPTSFAAIAFAIWKACCNCPASVRQRHPTGLPAPASPRGREACQEPTCLQPRQGP